MLILEDVSRNAFAVEAVEQSLMVSWLAPSQATEPTYLELQ